MSLCSALQRAGQDIELVAMGIKVMDRELRGRDLFDLYRVPNRFPIRIIRVPVRQTSGGLWLAINRFLVHAVAITSELRSRPSRDLAFYTKTHSTALVLLALKHLRRFDYKIVFETHTLPSNRLRRFVLSRADRVVAQTFALSDDLVRAGLVASDRVLGVHHAVDLDLIQTSRRPRSIARAELGLPADKKLVIYTGKIYFGYAEVEHLLAAARALEGRTDTHFLLVGGREDHVSRLRERIATEGPANVTFTGFVAPRDVLAYQFASDILVLYYPSGMLLNEYRSPGKLIEYMAAERPIVAADMPILREILGSDGKAAVFVPPDSPEALAQAISDLLDDNSRAAGLALVARERVKRFTSDERARRVLEFIWNKAPKGPRPRRAESRRSTQP